MNQMEAFRILASADRQILLHELLEGDQEASIADISHQVAARRHRTTLEKIDARKVERAHIRLVHDHLPKLQEKGILEIDWDENEIALANGENLDRLFDAAAEVENWPPVDLLTHPSRNT